MASDNVDELKRDPYRDALNWLVVLIALVLAALELYFGLALPDANGTLVSPASAIGALLLVLVVVFFTAYWRPALYLVLALIGSSVAVVWLLTGLSLEPLRFLSGVIAVALFALSTYQFYREEVAYETR